MLRIGRRAEAPVAFARLYGHATRSLRPLLARSRTYATEPPATDNNEADDKQADNKQADSKQADSKQAATQFKILTGQARYHESRLRALEQSQQRSQSPTKLTQETAYSADTAQDEVDNFNQALDVVRKVYGVKRKKKRPRPSKNKKEPVKASKQDEGVERAIDESIEQDAAAKPSPIWTSLQDRLKQLSQSNEGPQTPVSFFPMTGEAVAHGMTPPEDEQDTQLPIEEPKREPKRDTKRDIKRDTKREAKQTVKVSRKRKMSTSESPLDVKTIHPDKLKLQPVEEDQELQVPKLAHDLDRVLFNPGVYELQDKRSLVFNFDPSLSTIMPVNEFDFNALAEYVTSSKDNKLRELSEKHGKKFCGSTSSLTSMLSHFHFLLSAWRAPNFAHISRSFEVEFQSFTQLTRGPAAAFARLKDGVYAIDADKEFDSANILSMLGKSMEKLLTLPKEDFEKYRRTRSHQLTEEEKNAEEGFHYTTFGDFLLRSQLDAHDPRLPGTGMFDLKTRAVLPIRMDVQGYEKAVGYELAHRYGQYESFEREYYDMIRAAFLKYSLQVRMGRMDGIFVAYHNTRRIFGFQYISLDEMDLALHGTPKRVLGDAEFRASLVLLNDVLTRASEKYPGKSLRLHIETRQTNPPLTYFFAEPVEEEEADRTQAMGRAKIEKFEREVLGLTKNGVEEEPVTPSEDVDEFKEGQLESEPESAFEAEEIQDAQKAWDEMMAKVDETVENESLGLQSVRDSIEQALEQSGLLRNKSEDEKEAYLNSLVDALAEELSEGKESADEVGESAEREDGEAEMPEGKTSAGVSEEVAETDSIQAKPGSFQEAISNMTGTRPSQQPEAVSEETENRELDPRPEAQLSPDRDWSLKDLIIKVAQAVDNKSENLGAFERVLSELAAHSRQLGEEKTSGGDAEVNEPQVGQAESSQGEADDSPREIFGVYITVRNKVNGKFTERVNSRHLLDDKYNWAVEYTVTELPTDRAQRIYRQLKNRRRKILDFGDPEDRSKLWHKMWGGNLRKSTKRGQKFRRWVDMRSKDTPIHGAWTKEPISVPESSETRNKDEKEKEDSSKEST